MKTKTIVILHGWGLSAEVFAPLVKSFEAFGYKVYTLDLPGFGKTSMPSRPFTLADYAEYVHEALEKKKIHEPIFVGHSFGGRISLKYSKMYPKSVRALILTGTPGFTPIAKKKLLLFIFLAKIGGFIFSIPPLNLFQDWVRKWYYYVVGAREFFRAEGTMRETFKMVVKEELVTCMQAVNVPCLMLWGEYDVLVPEAIAHRMHAAIADSKLIVVPEADHGVPFKQPDVFAGYVNKFLQSL